MSVKQAAEELLKVADDIEKEAAEVTTFVCGGCNHTATLAKINQKRCEAAEKIEGEKVTVAGITVEEKIECPACDEGIMAYSETEESKAYYFEPKEASEEETKEASDPIDYDSFERYSS